MNNNINFIKNKFHNLCLMSILHSVNSLLILNTQFNKKI